MMKAFAIWVGVGAAIQLGAWFWGLRRRGRFATDVATATTLSRNHALLALQILISCATWPIALVVLFAPGRLVRRLFPGQVEHVRQQLRGRCWDCGGPLDGHDHTYSGPPPS